MFAYFCGEFVNSYRAGEDEGLDQRPLACGARFVGSTVAGEAVDSALFYPLAFYNSGIMPNELVVTLVFSQFITKTLVEIAFLPITYASSAFSSARRTRTITTATPTSIHSRSKRRGE